LITACASHDVPDFVSASPVALNQRGSDQTNFRPVFFHQVFRTPQQPQNKQVRAFTVAVIKLQRARQGLNVVITRFPLLISLGFETIPFVHRSPASTATNDVFNQRLMLG
jgi:hypothetical protein